MKQLKIFLFLTLLGLQSFAQTLSPKVSPSGGGYATGNNGVSLSWTMGETFTATLSGGGQLLSQGEQQPEIDLFTGSTATSVCAGSSFAVPYTANGYVDAGNVFTAQLSNASGSFAAAVNIGAVTATQSGNINATIPAGTLSGTGYRVRVLSGNPARAAADNGVNITVNALVQYYVDADADGYGSTTAAVLCSSTAPTGYSNNNSDCNDADANVYQTVNLFTDADGDGYESGAGLQPVCIGDFTPFGYSDFTLGVDCNDNNTSINPEAAEICDGIDNNCDGITDSNPLPVISGNTPFCQGSAITMDAGAGYASYSWSTGETTQTISISNTSPVSVTVTNNFGCSATSANVTPTLNTVSTAPTSITSSVVFATAGTNFTLSVNGGSLGTGATWKWYTGSCGGTLIGTGASISVSQTANTTYFVRAEGTCNTTDCSTITVNSFCGATGVTSSAGTTAICAGSPVTLTVIGSLSPGAQWRWDDECDNDDADHDCSYNTSSTFTVSPTSTKTYYVRSVGGLCGLTACVPITVTVIAKPARPGTISGSASVCPSTSVTYTIAAVAGATSYTWTAPTNGTFTSAQGGTSMTVAYASAFTSGILKVKANNCSGSSSDKSLSVAKQTAPATPGNISGASAPCKGSTQTYSTSAVSGATSYTWTLPTGVSFVSGTSQTGTSIQVVVASTFSSGTLSVKANNCGGSSSNRTTSLTGQSAPTAPGTITGPSSVTQNTANNTFSVSNVAGMTYNWTVPAGCTITLGQGTSTIKVTWGTVAGIVSVTRNNGCGNSVASTKSVSVKRSEEAEADAGMEGARTEETVETLLTQTDALNAIAVYPNPTTGEVRITFNTTAAGKYNLSIVDLQGRVITSTSGAAIEGNNTLVINLSNCSNGVYMIHLMHNDTLQTLRVVKM